MIGLPKGLNINDFDFKDGKPILLIKEPTAEKLKAFEKFKSDLEWENSIQQLPTDFKN